MAVTLTCASRDAPADVGAQGHQLVSDDGDFARSARGRTRALAWRGRSTGSTPASRRSLFLTVGVCSLDGPGHGGATRRRPAVRKAHSIPCPMSSCDDRRVPGAIVPFDSMSSGGNGLELQASLQSCPEVAQQFGYVHGATADL